MHILILTIVPVLLSTTIYNISSIIDNGIYKNIASLQGYTVKEIGEWWGVFTGEFKVLVNVPISIASAMAASCVPSLTAALNSKNTDLCKKQINMATRFIMIIAFPCAVGMMVLGGPILKLLFFDNDALSANLMWLGGISIVFYSLSTLSNGVLQGIDKMVIPVRNACIALVAHVIVLLVLMEFFDLHIYAVVISNTFYALCMCFLNGHAVVKYGKVSPDIRRTYIIPCLSSVVMGILVFLSYTLFNSAFSAFMSVSMANAVATLISILIGIIVYFVVLLLLKGVDEETLLKLPMGARLVRIAKNSHLLRG